MCSSDLTRHGLFVKKMSLASLAIGGFTMGAADGGVAKMDVSLDDIIKQGNKDAKAKKKAAAAEKKKATPKGKKGGPSKGAKRVGKKVTVAVIKRKSTAGPTGKFNIRGAPKVPLGDLRGTLKMTISNRGTPGKGAPGKPRGAARVTGRGKVQGGAAGRRGASSARQGGARGMDVDLRRGIKHTPKAKGGVAKKGGGKKGGSMFPPGASVTGKVTVIAKGGAKGRGRR